MKVLIIFAGLVLTSFAGCQRVYRCQEVSTWAQFRGFNFVPHQGVFLHGPNLIISFYGGSRSKLEVWSDDWEIDEPAVAATSSMTLEKIKKLETGSYNLLFNNCIHFKNRVLRYCEQGS